MLARGTLLNNGRYRIVRAIGKGGFGLVYEAQYLSQTGQKAKPVALKELTINDSELHPNRSKEDSDKLDYTFRIEALRLLKLRHEALPVAYDYFNEGDRQYLVMKYIEGSNLKEALRKKRKPFDIQQVLAWADQLLDVLAYLHNQSHPLIHRDIKPENLMLKPDGKIMLLDFGISKGGLTLHPDDTVLPGSGTPGYAPPEQLDGTGTGRRSDLYAVGATLYQLLTNKKPPKIKERKNSNDRLSYQDLVKNHPEIPVEITRVLADAMSLDINQRPSSARQMQSLLWQASQNSPKPSEQPQYGHHHTTLTNPSLTKPASSVNQGNVTLTASASNHTPRTPSSERSPWLIPVVVGGLIVLLSFFAISNWGSIFPPASTATPIASSPPTLTASSPVAPTPDSFPTIPLAGQSTSTPLPTLPATFTPPPVLTAPADVSALIEQGNALRNAGQHEQAIAAYADAIAIDPTNAEAYLGRGASHRERRELDLAIANYDDAIRFRADYVEAYYNRGIAYHDQGQLDFAITDYSEAIRLNPNDARPHNSRGFAYHSQGRFDLALPDYNEAIRLDPNYAWPYNNRGALHEHNGQLDLAIADYRQAAELGNETGRQNLTRLEEQLSTQP